MDQAIDVFIDRCLGRGGPRENFFSPEAVLAQIPKLREAGLVVASMHCARVLEDGRQALDLELAVLGLDQNKDDDWQRHHDADRITNVVVERLEEAVRREADYIFEIWLDDVRSEGL